MLICTWTAEIISDNSLNSFPKTSSISPVLEIPYHWNLCNTDFTSIDPCASSVPQFYTCGKLSAVLEMTVCICERGDGTQASIQSVGYIWASTSPSVYANILDIIFPGRKTDGGVVRALQTFEVWTQNYVCMLLAYCKVCGGNKTDGLSTRAFGPKTPRADVSIGANLKRVPSLNLWAVGWILNCRHISISARVRDHLHFSGSYWTSLFVVVEKINKCLRQCWNRFDGKSLLCY